MAVTITRGPGRSGNPYQVVQRSAIQSVEGFKLEGAITGAKATSIRLRVVNYDTNAAVTGWINPMNQQVDTDSFKCVVSEPVPTGSWYKWQVQLYNGDTQLSSETISVAWGVGVVGVLLGQSNMLGMWTTEASISPATSNTKVSVWLNNKPAGSGYSALTWEQADAETIGNGVYKLGDVIQTGISSDASHGDMPVGLIGLAIGATSLMPWADYGSVGSWIGDIGGGDVIELLKDTLYEATGGWNAEFVAWHQGEAEATNYVVDLTRHPKPGEYRSALTTLHDALIDLMPYWTGDNIPFIAGTIGRFHSYVAGTDLPASIYLDNNVVSDDVLEWTEAGDHGYFTTAGVDMLTTGADNGIHYSAEGHETMAERLGYSVLAKIGVNPSSTTVSKRGPRILRGVVGDDTDQDLLYSRQYFTLYVEHDQGTDLTLGTDDSIPAFEVYDDFGPLAITAISKGSTVSGVQPLVFTVERDTTQTTGVADGFDYAADNHIRGNRVVVKYLANSSIESEYMIFDNADFNMPLRPSWGINSEDEKWKWAHSKAARKPDSPSAAFIRAEIDAVASPSDTITIEAPNDWSTLGISENVQWRPGDRYVIQEVDGDYVATGTIRKVASYSDAASQVTLDLSHDMSSNPPSVGDFIVKNAGLWRSGGLVVMPRNPDHFGEKFYG